LLVWGAVSESPDNTVRGHPSDHTIRLLEERIRLLEEQIESAEKCDASCCKGADGLSEGDDGIFARVQVAKWPFHLNFEHLGRDPSMFYIEVGANSRDVLLDQMTEPFSRGAFLLTFEPLLDKYATLLHRYGRGPDLWSTLGLQHDRSLVLPFAVGCQGSARFHVTPADGCSSLLRPRGEDFRTDPRHPGWNHWMGEVCAWTVDERWVPCVSLETVIGSWLREHDVEHLKLDAQGFDMSVILSAGRQIERVKSVSLEVQCDSVAKLYAGAPNCSTVVREMTRLGFVTDFDPRGCRRCVELNLQFARPGSQIPAHLLAEYAK